MYNNITGKWSHANVMDISLTIISSHTDKGTCPQSPDISQHYHYYLQQFPQPSNNAQYFTNIIHDFLYIVILFRHLPKLPIFSHTFPHSS